MDVWVQQCSIVLRVIGIKVLLLVKSILIRASLNGITVEVKLVVSSGRGTVMLIECLLVGSCQYLITALCLVGYWLFFSFILGLGLHIRYRLLSLIG